MSRSTEPIGIALCLAAGFAILAAGLAAAGPLTALTAIERARVLSVACGSPALVADTANQMDAGPGAGIVQVRCAPQERVANLPVRNVQRCMRQAGGVWSCEPEGREFVLALNGRRVAVQFPVVLDAWAAYQMSRAMGPVAVPLAVPGSGGQAARCTLAGDNSDAAVARMTLDCDLYTVVFVKLCADSQCRFETVSRYAKRVQRLGLTMTTTPNAGWSR